jgi:peptidoglycan-associated lipoprotein
MVRRGSQIVAVSVLAIGLAVTGCAKRPATTQATAPAPTGAAGATSGAGTSGESVTSQPGTGAMQPGTAGGGSGTATGTPGAVAGATTTPGAGAATTSPSGTARPAVKEYAAVPELRDIYFDFDRYDVRPGDAKVLDANAQWLRTNPNHLVLIEGHCDERGTNEYNLALGERRAKSTMNYLVSQGVQASRITIISYGEERPACTEKNEECWSRNRRAHFLVKPR